MQLAFEMFMNAIKDGQLSYEQSRLGLLLYLITKEIDFLITLNMRRHL